MRIQLGTIGKSYQDRKGMMILDLPGKLLGFKEATMAKSVGKPTGEGCVTQSLYLSIGLRENLPQTMVLTSYP